VAHRQQFEFVATVKAKYPQNFALCRVLEVGSLDINGSVRSLFQGCQYIGLDVGQGRGVDIVCSGHEYDAPDHSYETVISCECFEHNPHWIETFANMHRLTRKGGLVVMTCATTGRPEHGTTRTTPKDSPLTVALQWDYYQNLTEQDFVERFGLDRMFSEWSFSVNPRSCDLYFYGVRR
jgi:SAM-dependent methyltransferase